jgi:hypothetical protein
MFSIRAACPVHRNSLNLAPPTILLTECVGVARALSFITYIRFESRPRILLFHQENTEVTEMADVNTNNAIRERDQRTVCFLISDVVSYRFWSSYPRD